MHGHQATMVAQDFDPLELDRYSKIQQLSRALAESASDMGSLKDLLQVVTSEAETLLVQQARVTAELQDGLMRTRMVPFQRHVPRLTRLVRQAATEAGKRAELAVEGASGELDRHHENTEDNKVFDRVGVRAFRPVRPRRRLRGVSLLRRSAWALPSDKATKTPAILSSVGPHRPWP